MTMLFASLFRRRRCCAVISNGWRSFATRTDLVLPWLMLSSPTDPKTRYFFDIVGGGTLELNRKIHLPQFSSNVCIGSSAGFLFTVPTDEYSPDAIHAFNPLNPKEDRLLLPPISTLHGVIADDYSFLYRSKIVLSPSRDVALLLGYPMSEYARLSPLASSSSWTPLQTHDDPWSPHGFETLNDCIFHKGRLYVSDHVGGLTIIDMDDPSAPPLLSSDPPRTLNLYEYFNYFRRSLVESPDGKDLFLLMRLSLSGKTFFFEVFKLGDDNSWNQVGSIGELVFFVGANTSFAVSADDFPNLEPNSIYFADGVMKKSHILDGSKYVGDTGVFSLDDGSVRFFNLTHGHRELNWPRPEWFMPNNIMS